MKNTVLTVGRYTLTGFVIISWKDFHWVEVIYAGYFFHSWFILLEVRWEWTWAGKKFPSCIWRTRSTCMWHHPSVYRYLLTSKRFKILKSWFFRSSNEPKTFQKAEKSTDSLIVLSLLPRFQTNFVVASIDLSLVSVT